MRVRVCDHFARHALADLRRAPRLEGPIFPPPDVSRADVSREVDTIELFEDVFDFDDAFEGSYPWSAAHLA